MKTQDFYIFKVSENDIRLNKGSLKQKSCQASEKYIHFYAHNT